MPLHTIDQKLLAKSQDAYLWLFDRTGIYVATIGVTIQVSVPFLNAISTGKLDYFQLAVMAFLCVGQFLRYQLQHNEKFEAFNAMSRILVTHWARKLSNVFWLTNFTAFVIVTWFNHTAWHIMVVSLLQFFFFGYVSCWQIRKREPPAKLVFASQAST